ncbi:hypothetical protein KKF86_05250 [bacterium]|nr:hypothetical protein [bacterium]
MTNEQFSTLESKLDIIFKLLAYQSIEGREFREQVIFLNNLGLQPKEIAELTGKTPNNISVTLNSIRKSKK